MRDVIYLDRMEQAETLLKPQRVEVLGQRGMQRVVIRLVQPGWHERHTR